MDRIEKYINSAYKNLKGNKNEIEDLKQDMKNHLLQTVEDLKLEGKTEDESIKIAISRFGELKQVENDLANVFQIQRKFATTILITSLFALLLSVICFISLKVTYKYKYFSVTVPQTLRMAIEDKIIKGEEISTDDINNLLTKYKKRFRYVEISEENNTSNNIIYPSDFSVEEIRKDNSNLITSVTSKNGTTWLIKYGFDIKGFNLSIPIIILTIAIILLVTYWILFGIWCVINAYHNNRLSLTWIILFFTLNIISYIAFVSDKVTIPKLKYS